MTPPPKTGRKGRYLANVANRYHKISMSCLSDIVL